MDNNTLFNYIKSIGGCNYCCLRYLQGKGNDYLDVQQSLIDKDVTLDNEAADHPTKKYKENPCSICLGLFQPKLLEDIAESVKQNSELPNYQTQKICSAVSFPVILQLRQLQVWIALLKEFPDQFSQDTPPDIAIKDAFRVLVNGRLVLVTNKYIDPNGITLQISFSYPNEEEILLKLAHVRPDIFKGKNPSMKPGKEFITRNGFERHFIPSSINLVKFKEQYNVPPECPEHMLGLKAINVKGPTVFVGGRYNKYSRELSQSPWILNNKRVMEDSVQELITRHVFSYFEVPEEKIIFSASGREDVDVRCLGKGRPFLLEIPDSKKSEMSFDIARNIEKLVNKNEKIQIRDLQMVSRESSNQLKAGEEEKKKTYRALCVINRPVTDEIIEKLNRPNGFLVEQKTPLRVLHRRPLLVRPRMIYSMTTTRSSFSEKSIQIDVVSQAGTYIKELVHSDFGRTTPSCRSILNEDIDIIALDVTAIDLNWPKQICDK